MDRVRGRYHARAGDDGLARAEIPNTDGSLRPGLFVEARIVTNEGTFTQEQAKEALPNRKY